MVWEQIEAITLDGAAASVSFASGLTAYQFFRLTAYILNDANAKDVLLRINNDSGPNYATQTIEAVASSIVGARVTGQTSNALTVINFDANRTGSFGLLIAKPAAGVKGQVLALNGINTSNLLVLAGGEWSNTADLINRIDVIASSNNFAAGTSILLEGLSF